MTLCCYGIYFLIPMLLVMPTLSRHNNFSKIMLENQQTFRMCSVCRRYQCLFLVEPFLNFCYSLLRRILTKSSLPSDEGWNAIICFSFFGSAILNIDDFKPKSQFRTPTQRGKTAQLDARTEKKESRLNLVPTYTAIVVRETMILCPQSDGSDVKTVWDWVVSAKMWKFDFVRGFVVLHFSTLFELPLGQSV